MGIFEFDQELHDTILKEDAWKDGLEEGIGLSTRIIREIQSGNMDDDAIALIQGCSAETVKIIRNAVTGIHGLSH